MLNVCLFGAGRIGQVHALAITQVPGVAIKYVVDVHAPSAQKLAEQYGAQVSDVAKALADDSVQAVIVASSTDTHADLMQASAAAGKHIFCEKPIDLDTARAVQCAEDVANAGVLCALGFNRRFDPQFARLHQQLQSGAIGDVEQLIITSRDPAPPPLAYIGVSGGLFRDMAIHDLDMARWLLGEDPCEVYATGSVLVDPAIGEAGDVDSAMIVLKTASGKLAHINNSRRTCYGYDQRIEAFGADGMLQANNNTDTNLVLTNGTGVRAEKPQYFFLERYAEAYRLELMAFARCVLDNEQPLADQHDGVAALKLADACALSLQSGHSIKLNPSLEPIA